MKYELIVWVAVIVAFALWDWHTIVKRQRYPNKHFRFVIRTLVTALFAFWVNHMGYLWYWTAVFTITTFGFLFPLALNIARHKDPAYLGKKKGSYDWIMRKIFKHEQIIFGFGFIFMLIGAGIMFFYGKCTWEEINAGLCR